MPRSRRVRDPSLPRIHRPDLQYGKVSDDLMQKGQFKSPKSTRYWMGIARGRYKARSLMRDIGCDDYKRVCKPLVWTRNHCFVFGWNKHEHGRKVYDGLRLGGKDRVKETRDTVLERIKGKEWRYDHLPFG